jgi:hypothetical protein
MRWFLPVLLAVGASACTTLGGRKTASGWYELQKAADVNCGRWPLRDKDLQLDDLILAPGAHPGVLASGLKRDASPLHYFSPLKGEVKADPDEFVSLDLGRQAIIVGGVGGAQPLVLVVRNLPGKAMLQVRTVKDNVVKYEGQLAGYNIVEGSTVLDAGGAWISFKDEDNNHHLAFVALKGGKISHRLVAGVSLREKPWILAQPSRPGALVVWADPDGPKPFKIQPVGDDGALGAMQPLDIVVASQVESWSAARTPGGDYLAFVDGDSLVGQAELKISYFNWADGGASVTWTKASPLKDVHVTEPVFVVTGKGVEVQLLNWIDEESTIARYMVAAGAIGKPSFSGVFPKGTRIVEAFTGETPEDVLVITRHRDDTRWAFDVCEL